ncbi:hypothetical protein BRPE64_ECDS01120 (plasmid) [Caballeronia insecticola]|uniref:Uncharacterized protein n=1 Tax=Caballeronia insecticola TaxID=758793 RepID=A0A060PQQ7_9BURK|nr:hypothetical protein BRPE64_ECDS01120 [Caballeronia insecticola]
MATMPRFRLLPKFCIPRVFSPTPLLIDLPHSPTAAPF